ncbi:hypothetical protein Hanom_Chr16g01417261 [Helianthus anomalus]
MFELHPMAKLDPNNGRGGGGGAKTYIPKIFYRTGGSKTYIPKNFYTKITYITLLSEKFGESGAPGHILKQNNRLMSVTEKILTSRHAKFYKKKCQNQLLHSTQPYLKKGLQYDKVRFIHIL